MQSVKYLTVGCVRGSCGHAHLTLRAAVKCVLRDRRECKAQGGYSDRVIKYSTGESLSSEDMDLRDAIEQGCA